MDVEVDVEVVLEVESLEIVQRSSFLTHDPSEHWLQLRGLANAAAPGNRNAPAPMRSRLRRVVSMMIPTPLKSVKHRRWASLHWIPINSAGN